MRPVTNARPHRKTLLETVILTVLLTPIVTPTAFAVHADLQAHLVESTVRIVTQEGGGRQGVGAGVIISQDDAAARVAILTAWHVIADAESIRVEIFSLHDDYPSPTASLTAVSVCSVDESADLAILVVQTRQPMPDVARLAPETWVPIPRSKALSCGCSSGEPPTIWTTIVASDVSMNHRGRQARFWRTKREPFQGESGGALVNERGNVIGICSMGTKEEGLYTHISEIHAFLKHSCLQSVPGGTLP